MCLVCVRVANMVGKACVHLVHWTWQHARSVDPAAAASPTVPLFSSCSPLSMPSANRHTYWQSAWDRATAAAPTPQQRRQLPLLFVFLLLQTIIYIHGQRLTQQQQQEKKKEVKLKWLFAQCSLACKRGRAASRVRASKQNAQLVCKYWKYFSLFFFLSFFTIPIYI